MSKKSTPISGLTVFLVETGIGNYQNKNNVLEEISDTSVGEKRIE